MTEEENKNLNTEQEESIDLQALFLKYFAYWPWFIASVIACLFVAFLYIRFCTPQYSVGASLLIKEEDKSQSSGGASPLAAIQDFGMFSMSNNFDNEVEILKSRTLIKKVVTDLGLYQSIYEKRLFGFIVNDPSYENASQTNNIDGIDTLSPDSETLKVLKDFKVAFEQSLDDTSSISDEKYIELYFEYVFSEIIK